MKGIILAAGRGSRMGSHTDQKPKCLSRVCGRTLLDWQVRALTRGGISDIHLIGGYRHQSLSPFGLPIQINPRWETTNMVGSLLCADPLLCLNTCIISYSDIIYPDSIVRTLALTPGDIVISYDPDWLSLWQLRFSNPLSDAETFQTDPEGRLTDIGRKTDDIRDIRGQYMGLIKLTAHGWNLIQGCLNTLPAPDVDKLDMTGLFQKLLSQSVHIHTAPLSGNWFEIDNQSDLKLCNTLWHNKKKDRPDDRD